MDTLSQIGNIVARARGRAKLSVGELGAKAGVSPDALQALEAGKPGVSTTELERIAEVLSLDPRSLLAGEDATRAQPSVFLRHAQVADFDHNDLPVLDAALEQGRALLELGEALGEEVGARKRFTPRETAGDGANRPAKEGYELARDVRAKLGQAAKPLGDARLLLESLFDVAVVAAPLASARSTALSVKDGAGAAAVLLNANDTERADNPALARVHLLHELCHILFDPSAGGIHLVVDISKDQKEARAEQRARAFAAEMLLPLAGLKNLLGAPKSVAKGAEKTVEMVREYFNTPFEIAANHLCNHGFIRADLRESLHSVRHLDHPLTTLPRVGGPSLLLAKRVRRAHDASLITDGDARRLLGIDVLSPLPWDRA